MQQLMGGSGATALLVDLLPGVQQDDRHGILMQSLAADDENAPLLAASDGEASSQSS